MFRSIRTLVASAVFSVALFALTGSALAMPAPETHGSSVPSAPVQTITEHSSSTSTAVWIVGGLLILAVAALSVALVSTRRNLSPRVARS